MRRIRSVWLLFFFVGGLHALPFAAGFHPEKTSYSFATYYAGMEKYGIILARQCALSVSCLPVLGIKKFVEHFFDLMEESIGLLIGEA